MNERKGRKEKEKEGGGEAKEGKEKRERRGRRWRERGRQEVHSKAKVDNLLMKNVGIVKRGTAYDRNNNIILFLRKGYMGPSLLRLFWRQPMVVVNVKNQVSLS